MPTRLPLSRILAGIAVILFVVAFLLAATVIGDGAENTTAWIAAGLAFFAAAFVV